jgi:hypothetical protein
MTRRRLLALIVPVAVLALSAVALAYWTTSGSGTASGAVGSLNAATISAPATSTGSTTVTWTQQASLPSNTSQNSSITYTVERKLGAGSYAAIASGGCSGSLPYNTSSCTDTVGASGNYTYRAVAHYNSWTATSTEAGPVNVTIVTDTTPPQVQSINRLDPSPTNAATVS